MLCINQDHHGFLWIGTKIGISRFDGIEFKNYVYSENDTSSLISGWTNKIIRNENDEMWFALTSPASSFMMYDDENDTFIDFSEPIKSKLNIEERDFPFWNIFFDNEGVIWLIHGRGAILFDPVKNKTTDLTKSTHKLKEVSETFIRDFYEDKEQNLWIISAEGLSIYNKKTDILSRYLHNPKDPTSISSNNCNCIFRDSENNLWIGTYNGLNKVQISPSGKYSFKVFVHEPDNHFSLSSNLVYDIEEDRKGNLLIATVNGLSLLEKKSQKIYRYYHDEIDDKSINANIVRQIFHDKDNNIWLATSGGIAKLQESKFQSFSSSTYKNSISHNKVQWLTEDHKSGLWISTPKGIDIFNLETGKFRFLAGITRNQDGLFGSPIVTCANPNKDGMLIGTWSGGFSYYSHSSKNFHNFINDELIEAKNIMNVLIDSKNNFWTFGGNMIFVYNQETKKDIYITQDNKNKNSLSSSTIYFMYEDSELDIWIATNNGLDLLTDLNKGTFKHYLIGKEIIHITESTGNVFWIATNEGIFRLNKKTGETNNYKEVSSIHAILEDKLNNLWISGKKGISRLKFSEDTLTEIITFRKEEGINIGDFYPRVCAKLSDGSIAFGGSKGFCVFKPEAIKSDTLPPSIVLTDLYLSNKIVKPKEVINGQEILQRSLINTNSIILNHLNNEFIIEFSGIQYNLPQHIKYAYRLDGYDDEMEWHSTDASNRKVEYMNLPAGDYTFKVKAANSYGLWGDDLATLNISILPPWWKTLWFRFIMVAAVITGFVSFYRYRLNALKRQKRVLEQKVAERTSELRDANSQLEEKQEEILQQNEEIMTVNSQLKIKNEEIEAQKEEIESSRNQLEKAFKNIQVLSEFGQKLTATFDFDAINKMIYEYVSSLMDTAAFGIGIYNAKRKIIDFPYFMEKGKPLPYFHKSLTSKKSLSVRCFTNKEEIMIHNLPSEYKLYLGELPEVQTSELPSSIIHIPLVVENNPIGTITVNSFKSNAYNENDVANLRTLASYISIALDNSKAYRIIRSKNEQISGSIRYGQTIQQAMLPPKKQLDNYFENFVLFRPKDIVSGDFYWFASINNGNVETRHALSLLAVVDCTGHGVPGAFMSMIGSRLLNDIVVERKIYSPAKILDQLNTMIRKALRQDTTDNHDGMDVCLCRFQQTGNDWELTYAGAKRTLLIFNSRTNHIEEIKGSRRSIGGVTSRKSTVEFSEETLHVSPNDVFYLSTDGLVDQCNPQKRKFTQKRLIELFNKVHSRDLAEQKKEIENELDSFQDGFEQRDDITLVGVKLK